MYSQDQPAAKPRVLVFIVAYNAEKTIAKVVRRIPATLLETYVLDVLIIDDSSRDQTFAHGHSVSRDSDLPFGVTILFNPVNQGYGGNQKLGYRYALDNGYDFVALVHGDGQYAPECLPELLEPLRKGEAGAVFGSRMLTPAGALRGGMPMYKFVGNRILTWTQNQLLRANLSEFHSGYRLYATRALAAIPFDRNENGFSFDTDIIIQLLTAGFRIAELPIPTYYGDEICHVNGMKYAGEVVMTSLKARLQPLGLFYDRKFDCAGKGETSQYEAKLDFDSPHTRAFDYIREGSVVLDIGCAGGYVGGQLAARKRCIVDGVDAFPAHDERLRNFYLHDLNTGMPRLDYSCYDYVIMLDVIEHLAQPELFLDELRLVLSRNPRCEVLISTANVAFAIPRLMMLIGQFNYGKRGILDLTHTRLFTFSSFERTIRQSGFDIEMVSGVPGPFPLAFGGGWFSRAMVAMNRVLIRLSRGFFSYQMFVGIKPKPTLATLLEDAHADSKKRIADLESAAR